MLRRCSTTRGRPVHALPPTGTSTRDVPAKMRHESAEGKEARSGGGPDTYRHGGTESCGAGRRFATPPQSEGPKGVHYSAGISSGGGRGFLGGCLPIELREVVGQLAAALSGSGGPTGSTVQPAFDRPGGRCPGMVSSRHSPVIETGSGSTCGRRLHYKIVRRVARLVLRLVVIAELVGYARSVRRTAQRAPCRHRDETPDARSLDWSLRPATSARWGLGRDDRAGSPS